MTPHTFVFIGRSGCGKGTQAKLLIEKLKEKNAETPVFYLETGQVFRDLLARGTYTGNEAKAINNAGGLQPEFLAVWAWAHILVENMRGDEHLIIDGTPRKLHEAPVLDSAFKFYNRTKPFIVYVNVGEAWARERLMARKRGDDTAEDIEKRLAWFNSDVVPAINFFKDNENYRFIDVVGEQTVEEVHADIMKAIEHELN